MGEALSEPVLIIKTAWGGKSLYYDFRPPSAGPFERSAADIEKNRYAPEQSGHYYRLMTAHVHHVLKDIKRIVPDYDASKGYEMAGFIWFQGWNDMVNHDVYPRSTKGEENSYAKYGVWMADFIRDVRHEFDAPRMPFVIGVMGVGGIKEEPDPFRQAMAAPAALPEFKGNVAAVQTAPYWDTALGAIDKKRGQVNQMAYFLRSKHKDHANKDGAMTQEQQQAYLKEFRTKLITPEDEARWNRGASNAGYHYLGCAKTFALMGKAYAEKMLELMKSN